MARNTVQLLNDARQRAEHIMLVDLGRNDAGKVSKYGSVKVERLMDVQLLGRPALTELASTPVATAAIFVAVTRPPTTAPTGYSLPPPRSASPRASAMSQAPPGRRSFRPAARPNTLPTIAAGSPSVDLLSLALPPQRTFPSPRRRRPPVAVVVALACGQSARLADHEPACLGATHCPCI
ncbi:hypothetical protein NL676_038277 [Syzygium grande]|nr:hypothetical protein NL676_038277 [Syzygium grande]